MTSTKAYGWKKRVDQIPQDERRQGQQFINKLGSLGSEIAAPTPIPIANLVTSKKFPEGIPEGVNFPIRCPMGGCNRVIGQYRNKLDELLRQGLTLGQALDRLGLNASLVDINLGGQPTDEASAQFQDTLKSLILNGRTMKQALDEMGYDMNQIVLNRNNMSKMCCRIEIVSSLGGNYGQSFYRPDRPESVKEIPRIINTSTLQQEPEMAPAFDRIRKDEDRSKLMRRIYYDYNYGPRFEQLRAQNPPLYNDLISRLDNAGNNYERINLLDQVFILDPNVKNRLIEEFGMNQVLARPTNLTLAPLPSNIPSFPQQQQFTQTQTFNIADQMNNLSLM
ncbi:DNA-directed RNA polymerase subunit 10 RPB10 [Orpheovirus IHUMI-LCC2]|uniref:DNA-directed RNA polymerase subunit 10 RPB10 n=1 Tax=Orpheovirus IHUMI-LCC2 TaxID=2023057 RepID=A0A2I2L6E7_9VIRU|nr:DNA-directed RNA polymerase subunit 10 RPB10 [Orpheovirus IHUMI-LCC2]SNW63039.1 DNA-directed RNA polymerase subunit 10 RPB10 [Orpheovirus IHUMI-LCC2]